MKKDLKSLILCNILFYLNNLLIILDIPSILSDGFDSFWFFSPFVLLLFTTGLLETSKWQRFKWLVISDFLIRCIVLTMNFLVGSDFVSFSTNSLVVLNVIFMAVNIGIEWSLLTKKQNNTNTDDELLTKEDRILLANDFATHKSILINKFPDEKEEINNIYHSTLFVGYSYVLILLLVIGGILAFNIFGVQNRTLILIISFVLLGIYFFLTNKKLTIFIQNRSQRKNISFRDNITLLIGLSIIYFLQGFVHIETGTFNFLGIFLAALFLIPTLKTNQLIREDFHKINKKYIEK